MLIGSLSSLSGGQSNQPIQSATDFENQLQKSKGSEAGGLSSIVGRVANGEQHGNAETQEALSFLTDERVVGKEFAQKASGLLGRLNIRDDRAPEQVMQDVFDELVRSGLNSRDLKTASDIVKGFYAIRYASRSAEWENLDAGDRAIRIFGALDSAGLVRGEVGQAILAVRQSRDIISDVIDFSNAGASREETVRYAAGLLSNAGMLPEGVDRTVAAYDVANEIVDGFEADLSIEDNIGRAATALVKSGVLPEKFAAVIGGIDAGTELMEGAKNALDGKPGAGDQIALAARALGTSGVLGEDVSEALVKGVQVYDTATSVLKLMDTPNMVTGVGMISTLANVIGDEKLAKAASIAALGSAIFTGGIGGIVLGAIDVLDNVFGTKIGAAVNKVIGKAADAVGGLLGKVGDAAEGIVEGVGDALGKVGKGVGKALDKLNPFKW